ncbi:extracellular catalytic domain type 1 short-chain-length polyhydroxyalkanoate depolymerase [Aquabacterium sp.]|uniref:extracellular catalytic domain type 1 short-chain-length polyhydroxyalkanoate depolymerase n=1 Tax=Aquabacterium sp. TaxID=1872578 RepID=UPI003D6CFFFF
MNPLLKQLMGQASRLTLAGDLGAATAAIQEALTQASSSPPRPDPGVIDVVAREVLPPADAQPTAKDATPNDAGRFLAGRHTDAIGARDYKLYVPPGHAGQALPLVVMLHGCTQDPDDFAAGTGMNEAARAQGFFVLYPAQTQHANAQRCWNWFKHNHQKRDRGEPALIANMTREVMHRHGIDPDRVYVAGLSAGGAMAAIVGAAYPDLFKAVGVHSGLPVGSATDISGALMAMKNGAPQPAAKQAGAPPLIVFHGDRDSTVHPANGEHLVAAHAGATTVEQEKMRSDTGRASTRRVHRDAEGRVVAEHWVVHGAGHAWSGGRAQGSYTDAKGPDATQEMLRFFKAHARRRVNAGGSAN